MALVEEIVEDLARAGLSDAGRRLALAGIQRRVACETGPA